MKQFLFFLAASLLLHSVQLQAQADHLPLPAATVVSHYKLAIGPNATTVLIFPAALKPAPGDTRVPIDRGSRGFTTQKQPGAENVLKLKAARKDFLETNLHVFTTDGRLFAFDISYLDSPAHTTYDLSRLPTPDSTVSRFNQAPILLSAIAFNATEMETFISRVKNAKPSLSAAVRHFRMKCRLVNIYHAGDLLFFSFRLANHSTLDYTIDFVKLYIRDKQKMNRSSDQQLEINPVYIDTLTTIPGRGKEQYIIAIPKITIPEHKQFMLEVYEKNGGRQLSLCIKNKELFKAKSL